MIEKTVDADGTTHVTMRFQMVSVTLPAADLKRISDEAERLRDLIRAVVAPGGVGWCPRIEGDCPWCGRDLEGEPQPTNRHDTDCPWPALVAEAEKP
jgi:hypothetical protein